MFEACSIGGTLEEAKGVGDSRRVKLVARSGAKGGSQGREQDMATGSRIPDGSQPLSVEVTVCMNDGLVGQTPRSAHVGCRKGTR